MEVGPHPRGGLVGDLDGVLQQPLRDDVLIWGECRLGAQENPVISVASLAQPFEKLLQGAQPACDQMDVLKDIVVYDSWMDG